MIHPLADEAALAQVLAAPVAVVYKHSPRCGVCIASANEVAMFAEGHPETPVYQIDVVRQRRLARVVSDRLGVPHESPQVILVAEGHVVWTASHWEVRAADLEEHLGRRTAP